MVVLQQDGGGTLAPCRTSPVRRRRPPRRAGQGRLGARCPPPAPACTWDVAGARERPSRWRRQLRSLPRSRSAGAWGTGPRGPRRVCPLMRCARALYVYEVCESPTRNVPETSRGRPSRHRIRTRCPSGAGEPGLPPPPCLFLWQRSRLHQACPAGLEDAGAEHRGFRIVSASAPLGSGWRTAEPSAPDLTPVHPPPSPQARRPHQLLVQPIRPAPAAHRGRLPGAVGRRHGEQDQRRQRDAAAPVRVEPGRPGRRYIATRSSPRARLPRAAPAPGTPSWKINRVLRLPADPTVSRVTFEYNRAPFLYPHPRHAPVKQSLLIASVFHTVLARPCRTHGEKEPFSRPVAGGGGPRAATWWPPVALHALSTDR